MVQNLNLIIKHELKGIQDKNSVAYFLINWLLLFTADVSGVSLKISWIKWWKISQPKLCNTILILDALEHLIKAPAYYIFKETF